MSNTAYLIRALADGHTIQSQLTDDQYKHVSHLLHATASRLEGQIKTIHNFDTAVTTLDTLSHLLNSYCDDNCGGCCVIVRKDNLPIDPASYDPINTNLIILDLTHPARAALFLCNIDASLITDDFDHDAALTAATTLTPKYLFNLNKPNERLLASAVLINMCEHTHDTQWEAVIKPQTRTA